MNEIKFHHSLQFRIKLGLLIALIVVLAVSSYLRYVSFRSMLEENLAHAGPGVEEIIQGQLAAYVRSRLALLVGSIVVIMLICDLMLGRMVVDRLKQVLSVVRELRPGNLTARVEIEGHDEITELARVFNRTTENLQRQSEKLSTLNTLAITVGQSLDLNEVLRLALDEVLAVTRLQAGWVILRDDHAEAFRLAASHGLPDRAVFAHTHCAWDRGVCAEVLQSGDAQASYGARPLPCRAAEYLEREGLAFRACVPLKSKDTVLGVMSLAGGATANNWMFTEDSLDLLTAIGRQIGVAVENASLYEELRQKEVLRRHLLERSITLQEDERRRIARELHDQTGQRLTSVIVTLGVLEEAISEPEPRAHVQESRATAAQILKEVRSLALQLRPSVLDDLGLLAALRHYLKGYQSRFRLVVDFHALGLDDQRMSPEVETALFRIAQQALTNVAQHAQAHSVTVLLENRGTSVQLIVEDDGQGFDVDHVMDARPHEGNLGLYGMQERAALLGGTLTVESTPGRGTSLFVRIPLDGRKGSEGAERHQNGAFVRMMVCRRVSARCMRNCSNG